MQIKNKTFMPIDNPQYQSPMERGIKTHQITAIFHHKLLAVMKRGPNPGCERAPCSLNLPDFQHFFPVVVLRNEANAMGLALGFLLCAFFLIIAFFFF